MTLTRLQVLVAEEGGLLAHALLRRPRGTSPHGDLVAHGPRAAGHEADLPLVLEAVREGYLLHHAQARVLDDADRDLALLAGDQLYALGLQRLAATGDLVSVGVLADLIALGAQAQAAAAPDLAEALWSAGAVELGWGPQPVLTQAKEAARAGQTDASEQLRAAARQVAGDLAPAR